MTKRIIPLEKSFASSDKASWWSLKNELKPEEVTISSSKIYLFNCPDCKHEFESDPGHLKTRKGCPYCANKKLCLNNDCNTCFEKSFASSNFSQLWSKLNVNENNEFINPRNIFLTSNVYYYF